MNDLDKITNGLATIMRSLTQINDLSEQFKDEMRKQADELERYAKRNEKQS